jgi:hypothetical protein
MNRLRLSASDALYVSKEDRYHVVGLETAFGQVFSLPIAFQDDTTARRMMEQIRRRGSANLEKWQFVRCIYGSEAYQQSGLEDELIEQEYYADVNYLSGLWP